MSTVLLLIDLQCGAFDGRLCDPMPEGDALIAACQRLLTAARTRGDRVVWVQHAEGQDTPMDRDGPGFAIDPRLDPRPEESVVVKTEPSAFVGTELAAMLAGSVRVLVAGLQSDCCVRATSLAGHALGLPMVVVADGHHTWPTGGLSADEVRHGVNAELRALGVGMAMVAEVV